MSGLVCPRRVTEVLTRPGYDSRPIPPLLPMLASLKLILGRPGVWGADTPGPGGPPGRKSPGMQEYVTTPGGYIFGLWQQTLREVVMKTWPTGRKHGAPDGPRPRHDCRDSLARGRRELSEREGGRGPG